MAPPFNNPLCEQHLVNAGSATSVSYPPPIIAGSPEWDLLLAASVTDAGELELARLRTLLERPIDWEALLRLADDHGTSSLMYQSLSSAGEVPAPALESFRERHDRNVRKSLFLARELLRILECIDVLGFEAIPYKGVVLSETYYGDMAMRQAGDMDLFIHAHDLARIKRAVRDLGYTPRTIIPAELEKDYVATGYECTFDSPAGKNLLELQWALQPRFYAVDFDMDGLFERAVQVTVAGRSVKTPSPEDLLLVLVVHAAKHLWKRLIWLCDIAQIVKKENLNWDSIQSSARELGIERILHISLLLVNKFLPGGIPEPIKKAVVADLAAQGLANETAERMASGVVYDERQAAYFRLLVRLRERRADRLRFLTRLTFTPGPGEWEAVRLPKALFPLYRVVRMARLASRLARG